MRAKQISCGLWATLVLVIPGIASVFAQTERLVNIRSNDVVGFAGAADVAAASFTGHLETLLAVRFPGARFRNFGWEGDTVFAQPRDFGFPSIAEHLNRASVSMLFVQFGRTEALSGKRSVADFYAAYDKLLTEYTRQTERVVLVTPPPFEAGAGSLPDLSKRNLTLAEHVTAVHRLAQKRALPLVDLFAELGGIRHGEPRLTDDGLQLTARGNAIVAAAFYRRAGFQTPAYTPGEPDAAGVWSESSYEKLRQIVIDKNQLWFNYWRPQNWAFLGGDRITQPSSRDHREPSVRWFPAEMEKYRPLIAAKEAEMEQSAAVIRGGAR